VKVLGLPDICTGKRKGALLLDSTVYVFSLWSWGKVQTVFVFDRFSSGRKSFRALSNELIRCWIKTARFSSGVLLERGTDRALRLLSVSPES
jgi:hypothetical protein